jgi:hypothetical protein
VGIFTKRSDLEKEWEALRKQETAYIRWKEKRQETFVNKKLQDKVPKKLQEKLDAAFSKAFFLVFEKGTAVIEKTYKKEEIQKEYKVREYAAKLSPRRKYLKEFKKKSKDSFKKNLFLSGVEGIGLGVLGIGLPDIPIFVGMILKSIYEISLIYGYSYEEEKERLYILQLIQNAMSYGKEFEKGETKIDDILNRREGYDMKEEILRTSQLLSKELIYIKFLQGLPAVGVAGGAYNTIYLHKILTYADIKYRKRFLTDWKQKWE